MRTGCIATLMAHEFGHVCHRQHDTINPIERATWNWWKQNFEPNQNHFYPVHCECGVGLGASDGVINIDRDIKPDDNDNIYLYISPESFHWVIAIGILVIVNIVCLIYHVLNKCKNQNDEQHKVLFTV